MTVVGAPLDLGQGRRGVDMGPSAILLRRFRRRAADVVRLPRRRPGQPRRARARGARGPRRARAVSLSRDPRGVRRCSRRSSVMSSTWARCRSCWAATTRSRSALLRGCAQAAASRVGVIWIDAHGDLNAPGDEPVRERPRDAARGRARPRGRRVAHPARGRSPAIDPRRVVSHRASVGSTWPSGR